MKKVLVEFGGAILLYIVIFFGIIAISSRVSYINNISDNTNNLVAINK